MKHRSSLPEAGNKYRIGIANAITPSDNSQVGLQTLQCNVFLDAS